MTLPAPDEWPVGDPTDLAPLLGTETVDLLARRAASTPDRTAVVDVDRGNVTTYATLDAAVDRVAAGVRRLAPPAPRVGLLLDAGPAFVRAYCAVTRLGGVVVPLNLSLPTGILADQIARADVDLLVCDRKTEETTRAVAPGEVAVASAADPDHDGVRSLEHAGTDAADSAGIPSSPVPLDADHLVMFTSGTTGRPKGVRLTLGNLAASAVASAHRLGVDPADRWLVPLPTYHMGGLAPLVRSTLYGTTTVLQREFDADATGRVLGEFDVTGVSLVPTMLARLPDAGWTPADRLRFVLLGGAPASPDLVERAVDRGVPVFPTYGTTETASQVATATPDEAVERRGTVGRPLLGTEVSVVDDDGDPAEVGERGELVVAGPTATPGYLDPERTAAAFDTRGFHTGDLGYRDEAGRLWVVGRVDDRIVTGGENVAPDRVADALLSHDAVEDVAVVGLDDAEWGERVAALVVPTEPVDGDPVPTDGDRDARRRAAVLDHAREHLADFAVPKTLAFAESLPRTESGTVDRDAVAERLRGATGSAGRGVREDPERDENQ